MQHGKLGSTFFGKLVSFLKEIKSVRFVDIADNLCDDPGIVNDKIGVVNSLIIAGCSSAKFFANLVIENCKLEIESTGVPVFACEFVDIKSNCANNASVLEGTECAKLLIKAYIEKATAATEIVQKVKPAKSRTVVVSSNKDVRRRHFLRVLLASPHYEEFPIINEIKCISGRSESRMCVDSCPFRALNIVQGRIALSERDCQKCGLCSISCPLGAMEMPSYSDSQALRLIDALADPNIKFDNRALVFTCDIGREKINQAIEKGWKSPGHSMFVRIPCIGSISPAQLIRSLELGFDAVLCVCPDSKCPKGPAIKAWQEMFIFLTKLAESLKIDHRLEKIIFDGKNFHSAISSVYESIVSRYGHSDLNHDPTAVKLNPRSDFAEISNNIAKAKAIENVRITNAQLPYFQLAVDNRKCSMCGACVTHCPEDALRLQEEENIYLQFSYHNCIGCGSCLINCPEKALSIQAVLDLSEFRENLFETKVIDRVAKCKRCGTIIGKESFIERISDILRKKGLSRQADAVYLCNSCKVSMVYD